MDELQQWLPQCAIRHFSGRPGFVVKQNRRHRRGQVPVMTREGLPEQHGTKKGQKEAKKKCGAYQRSTLGEGLSLVKIVKPFEVFGHLV